MTQTSPTRAPLLVLLLGLIMGLLLARHFTLPLALLLSTALLGSLMTLDCARRATSQIRWLGIFLLSTTLSFWAYGLIRLPTTPPPENLSLPAREAQLSLEIIRVMHPGEPYGKPSGIARVLAAPKTSRLHPDDQIYFRLKLSESSQAAKQGGIQIQRGLQVSTTGVLSPISQSTAKQNEFDAYLKDIGVHYRFDRTETLNTLRAPPAFDRFCSSMNERFQQALRLGAPEQSELPNVYVAMLLGRRIDLTNEQADRYRMTGTMHFFAISGLHIGVIATVIAQFLQLIRIPPRLSPWIGLPLLYLYVEITGASPSAMRAFLMATFFWASFALTRQRSPFAALIGSAVLVLAVSPEQLWSLGFQLSYAVVVSILLFGLPLHEHLSQSFQPYRWLPKDDWNWPQHTCSWIVSKVLLLFAISFSAWLASAPLSAGLFEFIAPGAILLNMLLVNLVAIVIIGGVISLAFATALLPTVAGFLNHAAWPIIYLMDKAVIHCATIPGAIIPSHGFPLILSYAILIAYCALLLWLQRRPHRLQGYALILPPLLVTTTMTAGLVLLH